MALTRIAWVTDIHLDFLRPPHLDTFFSLIRAHKPDALLVAGDIGESHSVQYYLKLLEKRCGCPVYFVLGNHDYYHSSRATVTRMVRQLCDRSSLLTWLNDVDVVSLTAEVALVGHDSWSDGRLGDFATSRITLEDYRLIDDLRELEMPQLQAKLHALGDEAAAHFRRVLPVALATHAHVLAVMHPPPFREACWYGGQVAQPNDDYLPHFTCKAVGDVLLEVMAAHPDRRLTVLCGHSHGAGSVDVLRNLRVVTGGAEYGKPVIQQVYEF
jgi:3',5'-cyclic AMP phosphodiesterase CpdA